MLDLNWDQFRPLIMTIFDELAANREQWENPATEIELQMEWNVPECVSGKVTELSEALSQQYPTSFVPDVIEGFLWDFIHCPQPYSRQAFIRGLPLNEHLCEALINSITGQIEYLKEWDAESARLASRAKQSFFARFFASIPRLWNSVLFKKKIQDTLDLPF